MQDTFEWISQQQSKEKLGVEVKPYWVEIINFAPISSWAMTLKFYHVNLSQISFCVAACRTDFRENQWINPANQLSV